MQLNWQNVTKIAKKSLKSHKNIIVLGELSFSKMPWRYYFLNLNELHVCNC